MNELQIFKSEEFGELKEIQKETEKSYFGFFYVFEYGDFVKIGSTNQPYERVMNLIRSSKYNFVETGRFALSKRHTNFGDNERIIHKALDSYRNKGTELFQITLNEAINCIQRVNIEYKDESEQLEANSERITSMMKKYVTGEAYSDNQKTFYSQEFGSIRTIKLNEDTWFVGKDIATALGYRNTRIALQDNVEDEDKVVTKVTTKGGAQETVVINESGLYALIFGSKLSDAKKFKRWVTTEVLPSIRKTGGYGKAMTIPEQIKLLAQGNVELEKKIDSVNERVDGLEQGMPLYGCEIDEVKAHVNRKGVKILGGKDSKAYRDSSIRSSVYSDMYRQLKREFGAVASYKSIKRKYIADVHEFIDCYEPPMVLREQIDDLF